jgi:hypothetical protein
VHPSPRDKKKAREDARAEAREDARAEAMEDAEAEALELPTAVGAMSLTASEGEEAEEVVSKAEEEVVAVAEVVAEVVNGAVISTPDKRTPSSPLFLSHEFTLPVSATFLFPESTEEKAEEEVVAESEVEVEVFAEEKAEEEVVAVAEVVAEEVVNGAVASTHDSTPSPLFFSHEFTPTVSPTFFFAESTEEKAEEEVVAEAEVVAQEDKAEEEVVAEAEVVAQEEKAEEEVVAEAEVVAEEEMVAEAEVESDVAVSLGFSRKEKLAAKRAAELAALESLSEAEERKEAHEKEKKAIEKFEQEKKAIEKAREDKEEEEKKARETEAEVAEVEVEVEVETGGDVVVPRKQTKNRYRASRKTRSDFDPRDLFLTPLRLLHGSKSLFDRFHNKLIWEPCNGPGNISNFLKGEGFNVVVSDKFAYEGVDQLQLDFLECEIPTGVEAIIANPPFYLAKKFLEKAQEIGKNLWL